MLKGYKNLRGSFDIQKVVNNDFFLYLKTEGFRFRALPAEASAKAGSGLCQPKPRRRLVPGFASRSLGEGWFRVPGPLKP